jgi:cytochrome c oxidase subunit 3
MGMGRRGGVATEAHAHAAHHEGGHGGHGHVEGLQHQFDDMGQQKECMSLGMWLFLATEVMMFGGLFFAYSLYRAKFEPAFHFGSSKLNITLGTANTFVLLFSSLTMAKAVHAAGEYNKKLTAWFLLVTWILGAAFLGVKAVEWSTDWKEGLIPGLNWHYFSEHAGPEELAGLNQLNVGPHHVLMYFVIYFSMTGLHAIHMIVGLALVGWFIYLTLKGQFLKGNEQPIEIMGLYWHLVDIIWIFLFPLLYLIAGFHPPGLGGGAPAGGH